jgi:hypothetical protein
MPVMETKAHEGRVSPDRSRKQPAHAPLTRRAQKQYPSVLLPDTIHDGEQVAVAGAHVQMLAKHELPEPVDRTGSGGTFQFQPLRSVGCIRHPFNGEHLDVAATQLLPE